MRASSLTLFLALAAVAQEPAPPKGPAAPWLGRWIGDGEELRLEPVGETRLRGRVIAILGGELVRGEQRWTIEVELHANEPTQPGWQLRGSALGEESSQPLVARLDEDELLLSLDGAERRFARGGRPRELVARVGQRWELALEGGRRRVLEVTAVDGARVTYVARELAPDAAGALQPAGEPSPPATWTPEAGAEAMAAAGGEPRLELVRMARHRVSCEVRGSRWFAVRAGAPAFPGEVRHEVGGRRVLDLVTVTEPPGPDLSQLRVGQCFVYRMAAGGVEMTQEWVVTELGPSAIKYTLQVFMSVPGQGARAPIGEPTPLEWPIPPPGAPAPGPGPEVPGLTTTQENVTVGDVTFECVVYQLESDGQVTRSWTPVSRGFPTFPPILRSELDGELIMDLVEIR